MNTNKLRLFIETSLKEDLGDGDHTSMGCIPKNATSSAKLLIKDNGIIAGIELAVMIFKIIDNTLEFNTNLKDGDSVKSGDIAFIVSGNARSILSAERLVLNCMQRMSAIATKTNYLNSLISHTKCKLLDTRKTTPLNRIIEKWAVLIGGGLNHRFGLFDKIMIKDNHIDFAGGIHEAINKSKSYISNNKRDLEIIVEARNIDEVKQILKEKGVKRILLDNFDFETTKEATRLIKGKCESESSGGITEKTIIKYAECGVNYISVGALTHSVLNFDLSLKAI